MFALAVFLLANANFYSCFASSPLLSVSLKVSSGTSLGGSVLRILHFQTQGHEFEPRQGTDPYLGATKLMHHTREAHTL